MMEPTVKDYTIRTSINKISPRTTTPDGDRECPSSYHTNRTRQVLLQLEGRGLPALHLQIHARDWLP